LRFGLVVSALSSPERRNWVAAGFLYAATAEVASVLVRLDVAKGFAALMLVLLIVWVTDIAAILPARIGGPKLWRGSAPRRHGRRVGGFGASLVVAASFAAFDLGKTGPLLLWSRPVGRLAAWRSLRVGREATFRRQGFQPIILRPWRPFGPPRRILQPSSWRRFSVPARRRGWRRPRSYGLVNG